LCICKCHTWTVDTGVGELRVCVRGREHACRAAVRTVRQTLTKILQIALPNMLGMSEFHMQPLTYAMVMRECESSDSPAATTAQRTVVRSVRFGRGAEPHEKILAKSPPIKRVRSHKNSCALWRVRKRTLHAIRIPRVHVAAGWRGAGQSPARKIAENASENARSDRILSVRGADALKFHKQPLTKAVVSHRCDGHMESSGT